MTKNKYVSLFLFIGIIGGCITGCDSNNNSNSGPEKFSEVSREAYSRPDNGIPSALNNRNIVNDVSSTTAYDDLLASGSQ